MPRSSAAFSVDIQIGFIGGLAVECPCGHCVHHFGGQVVVAENDRAFAAELACDLFFPEHVEHAASLQATPAGVVAVDVEVRLTAAAFALADGGEFEGDAGACGTMNKSGIHGKSLAVGGGAELCPLVVDFGTDKAVFPGAGLEVATERVKLDDAPHL